MKRPIGLPALIRRIEADILAGAVALRVIQWPSIREARQIVEPVIPSPDGPRWTGIVEALSRAFSIAGIGRGELSVTLPNRFARFLLVPHRDELRKQAERVELARHLFVNRFGTAAEDWVIRVSGDQADGAVACALDAGFHESIKAAARSRGLMLRRCQPVLVRAFNANRWRLSKGAYWFAVLEDGGVALALIEDGCWRGVAYRRIAGPLPEPLLQVMDSERQMLGFDRDVNRLVVGCYGVDARLPERLGDLEVMTLPGLGIALGEKISNATMV